MEFDPRPDDLADERDRENGALTAVAPLPPHLSPSSAGMFRQCARRWRFRYVDRLPDPPGEAALAGSFAHRVLELLFELGPDERTIERAKDLARDVWPETESHDDFGALGLDDQAARAFRWRGWLAIEGLWTLEDPTSVVVEATEQDVRTQLGEVPFRGVIDRLERDDKGLVVTDYKSGRAPSPRFRQDRLGQVLLYAAAVEAHTGERPTMARLLYLGQRSIEVSVTESSIQQVVTALAETWDQLRAAVRSDAFETSPGPLCGWCPFAADCPEGMAEIARRHGEGRLAAHAPALELVAS